MPGKYTEEQLRDHFDCYDLNQNGEISWSELLKAIKRCSGYGDEEVEIMAKVSQYAPRSVRPRSVSVGQGQSV